MTRDWAKPFSLDRNSKKEADATSHNIIEPDMPAMTAGFHNHYDRVHKTTSNTFGDHTVFYGGDYVTYGRDMKADLRVTDPHMDLERIKATNGGLVKEANDWVFKTQGWLGWKLDDKHKMLWVAGHVGKGKTMLFISMIEALWEDVQSAPPMDTKDGKHPSKLLAFAFCDYTDSRMRSATAVLRTLVWQLVVLDHSLERVFIMKYLVSGKELFEDINAFYSLSGILRLLLQTSPSKKILLAVDGLDQCVENREELLDLITDTASDRVKWLLTSRHKSDIEDALLPTQGLLRLVLEKQVSSITNAVGLYTEAKIVQLTSRKKYDRDTVNSVREILNLSSGSYLWASAMYKALLAAPRRKVRSILVSFPPALQSTYEAMMSEVRAIPDQGDMGVALRVLGVMSGVGRAKAVRLDELVRAAQVPREFGEDAQGVRELASLCGSFVCLEGERVSLVQSTAGHFLARELAIDRGQRRLMAP